MLAPRVHLLTKESKNEDKALCTVTREDIKTGCRLIEAVVDSGAEATVAPPNLFPGKVVPTAMSRAGGSYN